MRAVLLAFLVACGGGAAASPTVVAPDSVAEVAAQKKLTVLLFFSSDCPVQKAHDGRLRDIAAKYEAKGVGFHAVVSEAGANYAADKEELTKRGLTMPMIEDKDAKIADALGVEYSTHVVVLDPKRHVLYSGGIDSERSHVTPTFDHHLENALDDALSGSAVRKAKTEALGCPLKKH